MPPRTVATPEQVAAQLRGEGRRVDNAYVEKRTRRASVAALLERAAGKLGPRPGLRR